MLTAALDGRATHLSYSPSLPSTAASHLAEGEHALLGAHDAALQHEEIIVDLPIVRKSTLWGEAEGGWQARELGGRR